MAPNKIMTPIAAAPMSVETLTLICPNCDGDMVLHRKHKICWTCTNCPKTLPTMKAAKAKAKAAAAGE